MGILDAPAKPPSGAQAQALMQRLRRNQEDAVIAVLGDSTGNETTEWVYRLAQYLGSLFATHSVIYRLWNDGTQTYDAPVTIQTGSGARTLSVYNASTPGQTANYSFTRLAIQIPVTPNLVITSYAYNSPQTGILYRPLHYQLCRDIQLRWPLCDIINTAQPPMATSQADALNHINRTQAVLEMSSHEGHGVVNVMQRFLDYGNYTADLVSGDGVHPTAAGMDIWVGEIQRHFRVDSLVVPQGPRPQVDTIWKAAPELVAHEGAPTLAVISDIACWALDPATRESVSTTLVIPSHWATWDMYAVWTTAAGSTSSVRWEGANKTLASYLGVSGSAPGGVGVNASVTQAARSLAMQLEAIQLYAAYTTVAKPIMIRVARDAAHAADTLTTDALLVGYLLRRAS